MILCEPSVHRRTSAGKKRKKKKQDLFHSMTDNSGEGGCCRCLCSFILTTGLTALFLWLSLRGSNPKCSIQDFYVPALNLSANSTVRSSNHSIYFDLKLDNGMKDKGVRYDDINLTFYYSPNHTNYNNLPIGNYTINRFYQGHGKDTHRKALVETRGVPWANASETVSSNGTVVFRLDLSTKVRYKILFWYTKKHKFTVGANVDVNATGQKVNSKKGIRLKSAAATAELRVSRLSLVGFFVVLCFLDLLF